MSSVHRIQNTEHRRKYEKRNCAWKMEKGATERRNEGKKKGRNHYRIQKGWMKHTFLNVGIIREIQKRQKRRKGKGKKGKEIKITQKPDKKERKGQIEMEMESLCMEIKTPRP